MTAGTTQRRTDGRPDESQSSEQRFRVTLTLLDDYQFRVDFGESLPTLQVDEPPPLGQGQGPNAARILGAAIANCLGASLLFCLRKSRINVTELRATIDGTVLRNERGRLRIGGFRVKLEPAIETESWDRVNRCVDVFEDYCLVTQSVRDGIDVAVEVQPTAHVS